jgi:hypothetical protein
VLVALAVPALAGAVANPVTFNYSNSTAITAYARPTGAVVVGRNFFNPALVDRIQNGGGEVYQYVNLIDGYWTSHNATGDQAALYGGGQTPSAYLWKPTRYNFADLPMTDVRPGSPWVLHAVEHVRQWFPTTHAKGIFLDVMGDRLWTGAWDAMSASERSAWTAGNIDLIRRLRAALGPNVILIANNIWENGNPDLNGITVEHHPFSEAARWSSMLQRGDWFKPTRNIVIANSTGEALSWAARPGVTHVSAQGDYGGPAAPVVGFSLLPGVSGIVPTAAPALVTPVVAPPPVPVKRSPTAVLLRGNLLSNPSFEKLLNGWTSWRGSVRRRPAQDAPSGGSIGQVAYGGPGAKYGVARESAKSVTTVAAGQRYAARAWVRAGSRSTVDKPITVYLRERSATGALIQEIRGKTLKLRKSFRPVGAAIAVKTAGSRITVSVVQDRARAGNSFQFDAISLAPVR